MLILSSETSNTEACIDLLCRAVVRFASGGVFAVLFLSGAVPLLNSTARAVSAQEDSSFRMIDNALSPQGLSNLLGTSSVVNENVFSDKVTKMLAEKLQNLDPESLSKLGDIAKKFSPNDSKNDLRQTAKQFQDLLKNDKEFRSSIESLAQDLRDPRGGFNVDKSELAGQSGLDPEDLKNGMIDRELQKQIEKRIQQFSRSDIATTDLDSLRSGLSGVPSRNIPNQNGGSPFSSGVSPSISPNDAGRLNPRNRAPVDPSMKNRNGNLFDPNGSPEPALSGTPGRMNSNDRNPNASNGNGSNGFGQANSRDNSSPGGFSPETNRDGTSESLGSGFSNPERSSAGASEQSDLPKENVGRKFNRILMKSLSNAVEKKLNRESTPGFMSAADGTKSSFDRLLTKLIDKMQQQKVAGVPPSNVGGSGNPDTNRGDRSKTGMRRSRSRWIFSGPSASGGAMPLPGVSARNVVYFLVFAAAAIAFIVFLVRQTTLGSMLGFESRENKFQTPPNYSESFSHQGEIVASIDKLALWLFGSKAVWWNSKIVNHEFSSNRPELTDEINEVMTVYDNARYAPDDQTVSSQVATDVRSTLVKLADPAFKDKKEIE